jgi:hypothetical protein
MESPAASGAFLRAQPRIFRYDLRRMAKQIGQENWARKLGKKIGQENRG